MKWLRDVLARPARSLTPPESSSAEGSIGPLELSALTELESKLDILTRGGTQQPCGKDDAQAHMGERVEAEVRRFFGSRAVQGIQSTARASGHRSIVFAADRLLVTFLGRRAAMAVTRKLYSDPT